jgi:hypothetical protein
MRIPCNSCLRTGHALVLGSPKPLCDLCGGAEQLLIRFDPTSLLHFKTPAELAATFNTYALFDSRDLK